MQTSRYANLRDARWMFAFAHFRITQQINDGVKSGLFRNPDQLLRFNAAFATAFLAAVAGKTTAPWRHAFDPCEGFVMGSMDTQPGCEDLIKPSDACKFMATPHVQPFLLCAVSMADAHINTDIVNALQTVGCIDAHDYGNVLL